MSLASGDDDPAYELVVASAWPSAFADHVVDQCLLEIALVLTDSFQMRTNSFPK